LQLWIIKTLPQKCCRRLMNYKGNTNVKTGR
jgi:hypothetical protein